MTNSTRLRALTLTCFVGLLCAWSLLNCTEGGLPSDGLNLNEVNTNVDDGGADNGNGSGQPGDNDNDTPGGGDNENDNSGGAGNDNGGGTGNDNSGGSDNDNRGGDTNDNMDGGGSIMGWRYRSIWDAKLARIEIREKRWANGKARERDEVRVDNDGRHLKHGICMKWTQAGTLEMRGEFVDGLPDGRMETWYDTGQRKMTSTWRSGKLHGPLTSWDLSGTVILRREYVYGMAQ